MGEIAFFLSALGLGLAFCATPGAVNTEALRRGTAHGFGPALSVQLGSLTGDVTWAVVALSGLALLLQHRAVALLLGVAGGLFLLRLAYGAFREAVTGDIPDAPASARGNFLTGAVFSLTNPYALAFWLGMGAGVAGAAHASSIATVLFFAGFFCGAVGWCLLFAGLVAWGRRYVTTRLWRAIGAVCGTVLGFFGVRLLLLSLRPFL